MKVLIVGAGIGGLALATHLHQDGHTVSLIEKNEDGTQVDYVMALWKNGRDALASSRANEYLQALGLSVECEEIQSEAGAVLSTMRYGSITRRYGPVLLLLHSDLYRILREMAVTVPIRFGTTICTLQHKSQKVAATLSDGSHEQFDLVVGADGTYSSVRELLFGQRGIASSGLSMWLHIMSQKDAGVARSTDIFGKGKYLGIFPSATENVGILFLTLAQNGQTISVGQRVSYLREQFGAFGGRVPAILASLDDPTTIFHANISQVSLEVWYRGRVVLLGDAAHALSPTVAMGAAMALEDAFVLAEELRKVNETGIEQALITYTARRKARIAPVRRTADFLIWLVSIKHPAMLLLRNTSMRLLPSTFLLRDMKKIVASSI